MEEIYKRVDSMEIDSITTEYIKNLVHLAYVTGGRDQLIKDHEDTIKLLGGLND